MKLARPVLSVALLSLLLATAMGLGVAAGPERELHFERLVPSRKPLPELEARLADPANWPSWFFHLKSVEALAPERFALKFNSGKSPWSAYTLVVARVATGSGFLKLRVLEDSQQKLTKHFDALEWEIRLRTGESGVQILGTAQAKTRSWRARLLGAVMERIFMSQAFLPDLLSLSGGSP